MVKQTGDGHLIEFPEPSDALRAAEAIVVGVRVLGVGMRAGLHTGEIERRRTGDIGGLAVHVAARIAALAAADEVLASSTVSDLVDGSGVLFDDRGVHDLRGVPGQRRVMAMTLTPSSSTSF